MRALIVAILLTMASHGAQGAWLGTSSARGETPVQSWKARRDAGVVKQALDYSCGAASLATLLNGYYGLTLTEAEVLEKIGKDAQASFAELAAVARGYGFRAAGVALDFATLARLTQPVIVYVRPRGEDHFSLIRGLSASHVWLADPAWGNRVVTVDEFLAIWETRGDPLLKGKALVVLPPQTGDTPRHAAFFQAPSGIASPGDRRSPRRID